MAFVHADARAFFVAPTRDYTTCVLDPPFVAADRLGRPIDATEIDADAYAYAVERRQEHRVPRRSTQQPSLFSADPL